MNERYKTGNLLTEVSILVLVGILGYMLYDGMLSANKILYVLQWHRGY